MCGIENIDCNECGYACKRDGTEWYARKTEYGIMVGRYINDTFEDIHFKDVKEYEKWKETNSVIEHFKEDE